LHRDRAANTGNATRAANAANAARATIAARAAISSAAARAACADRIGSVKHTRPSNYHPAGGRPRFASRSRICKRAAVSSCREGAATRGGSTDFSGAAARSATLGRLRCRTAVRAIARRIARRCDLPRAARTARGRARSARLARLPRLSRCRARDTRRRVPARCQLRGRQQSGEQAGTKNREVMGEMA